MGLFSLFNKEIAMDLGTANSIVIYNDQVVIDEPSVVAINNTTGKIEAVGKRAQLMEGKTVKKLIETLHDFNPEVHVDCFVVMPNHVHIVLKIDDLPTNDEHHLGKIMRKLKSLAAREYRLLKERGQARDIGTHLWEEN